MPLHSTFTQMLRRPTFKSVKAFLVPFCGVLSVTCFALSYNTRTSPAAVLKGEFNWTHDPSRVVKSGDKYYMYYTGDKLPMRYSTDFINWKKGKPVFEKVPEWVRKAVPKADSDFVWAPDIIFTNGQYYLYYSFSTFGSIVSVTGLLTSPTLDPESPDYKWTDQGVVLATKEGSDYNAIDPAPIFDAQGNLWLTIGSWNRGGIKLTRLDNKTGKPIGALTTVAAAQPTGPEAPYLHYRNGYYYLFENEGNCCRGMDSTYKIMMGRSKSITGPYLDKDGKDLSKGGGSEFFGTNGFEIGPGHVGIFTENGIDRFTFHYYDARSNGVPTMGLKTLVWGEDGWPRVGEELAAGRYAIISQASGLALGIYNNKPDDGTPIDQFTYRGGATQQWNVAPTDDGTYSIASLGTGKFMDLLDCGAKDGTKINQYKWFGSPCQRWNIEQTSDGSYRVSSKSTGTVLTLPNGSKEFQAQIQGSAWTGDSSQKWIFKRLP